MNLKYVLIGLVRRRAPEKLLFSVMKLRGQGSAGEEHPDTYFAEWQERLSKRGVSLAGKHILDFGSGRYARFALWMLVAGARRITLIDFYATPLDAPEHQAMLKQDCARLGLDYHDALARIEVLRADILELPIPAPENQVDIVVSTAVLEHVRDPERILSRCWAWLKPGGVTYHLIDLRDHNLSFRYPFEMLTFSDRAWERWFDLRGGFHLNRWRAPDYLQAMRVVGFALVSYDVFLQDAAGLKDVMYRLNRRFLSIDRDMLAILGMYVYGEKPLAADARPEGYATLCAVSAGI